MSSDSAAPLQITFTPEFKRNLRQLAKRYHHIKSDLQPILDQLASGNHPGDLRLQSSRPARHHSRILGLEVPFPQLATRHAIVRGAGQLLLQVGDFLFQLELVPLVVALARFVMNAVRRAKCRHFNRLAKLDLVDSRDEPRDLELSDLSEPTDDIIER